jgi:hypothetical protein
MDRFRKVRVGRLTAIDDASLFHRLSQLRLESRIVQ